MQIRINDEKKELKLHGSYLFPVFVSHEVLSDYERGAFAWHWHPEIELTYVEEGEISYQVNDSVFHLSTGEGLVCNANALHTGHMINESDCHYLSITFHPRMLYGFEGSMIAQKYVEPVLQNAALGGLKLSAEDAREADVLHQMRRLGAIYDAKEDGFELEFQRRLVNIWEYVYFHVRERLPKSGGQYKDIERLRKTITYLQEHYQEHVTLEEIADHLNLCASECCRFFKRHMNQTIFAYLMEYRIEKSLPLLMQGEESITDIAQQCGFSNPAYFGKVFHQIMKCSPSEYRKSFPQRREQ